MVEAKARCLSVRSVGRTFAGPSSVGFVAPTSLKYTASPSPSTSSTVWVAYSDKNYSGFSTPTELTEQRLTDLALDREYRFGTLEFSWAVRNCFNEWRTLAQDGLCTRTFPGSQDGSNKSFLSSRDVILELQSSLMDREDAIHRLQQIDLHHRSRIKELEQLVQELTEKDRNHQKQHGHNQRQLGIHKKTISEFESRIREYENETSQLQRDHALRVDSLREEANSQSAEAIAKHNRLRQDHESRIALLEQQWQERLTEADGRHSRLQDEFYRHQKEATRKYDELQQEHGLHLSRLEKENGIVLRNATEAQARLEEEWGLKLRTVQEDRDLKLKQMEEVHIARVKQCCSRAVLSLAGGRTKAVLAIVFEGWIRAVEKDALERRYEQQINEAEGKQRIIEEEWRARVAELNAEQRNVKEAWERRLQAAESERERILREIEDEKRVTSRDRANKAAFAMIHGHGQRFLLVVLHGWMAATTRALCERDLEAQLRGADEKKSEMMQERDFQLRSLEEERRRSRLLHEEQLRHLAASEGDKLRRLQEQHDNLRDDLETRIKQQEDKKMAIISEQVASRMQRAAELLAIRLLVRQLQARIFTAWVQFVAWVSTRNHVKGQIERSPPSSSQQKSQIVTGRTVQIRMPVQLIF